MTGKGRNRLVASLLVLGLAGVAGPEARDDAYMADVQKWRVARAEGLKADGSWLTVAGLFWLRQGENTFGTDPLNDFVLPAGSVPSRVGVFVFRDGKTTVRIEEGVTVTLHGQPIRSAELRPGAADTIAIGALSMFVHRSGDRYAVRLRDLNSPLRKQFTGLKWFPIDESYRVTARFVPYETPKPVAVPNILGDIERYASPGSVVFTLRGQEITMEPVISGDDLFFIFRDLTSGKETYPSARFMTTDMPRNGEVVIDFNKAYNPPCAYNPFTTCPLPPEQNRLRVRIEAGELPYHEQTIS